MFGRRLANLLIGLITLWAIYTIIAWLLDVSIMFPFVEVEPDEIPMGRMHAIRLEGIVSGLMCNPYRNLSVSLPAGLSGWLTG